MLQARLLVNGVSAFFGDLALLLPVSPLAKPAGEDCVADGVAIPLAAQVAQLGQAVEKSGVNIGQNRLPLDESM
ncbi:MAG TPA: hypothetical protein EYP49_05235 [Anaerolineae bacterium]|nr:hypothetical protein [Anaerolineae bacterium]